jgi:hypothetical protein
MDGAPASAESLWPSVIQWKPVFSNNWKNIKNRWVGGGGGGWGVCQLFLGMARFAT